MLIPILISTLFLLNLKNSMFPNIMLKNTTKTGIMNSADPV